MSESPASLVSVPSLHDFDHDKNDLLATVQFDEESEIEISSSESGQDDTIGSILIYGTDYDDFDTDEPNERVEAVEHFEKVESDSKEEVTEKQTSKRKCGLDSKDIDRLLAHNEYDYPDADDEREEYSIANDTVKLKANFLQQFTLPSISDFTETRRSERKSKRERGTNDGFEGNVNLEEPVASTSSLSSTSKTAKTTPSSTPRSTIDADQRETLSVELSLDDDILANLDNLDLRLRGLTHSLSHDKEDIDVFLQAQTDAKVYVVHEALEQTKTLKRRQHEELAQITQHFLYEMFDTVVEEVTNYQNTEKAKNKLDKEKIIRKLIELQDKYLFEQEYNAVLNSKMVEYYKRWKNARPFAILSDSNEHFKKYREALTVLDHRLKVAADTKTRTAFLMSSVSMDLSYIMNIVMGTEEHFDDLVMKTLTTNRSDYMKHVVERELRYMSQLRYEISDTRLFLITRKHTLGRIVDRIKKLETINEDICMDDFITIQNQVVALYKKIEERNAELKRMRLDYHAALHQTQHIHEKSLAIVTKLATSQIKLVDMAEQEGKLIKSLKEGKTLHRDLRKKLTELSYQGALLFMPSLLHDYDESVDKINNKKASIMDLKHAIKQTSQRIAELETQCV
ncbi:hypothetical protein AWZ03_001779 [Drosophila navojoa]|uniref:CCDC113/CCDC96 coiled-coil domain-containing protein n=1 Tax=Drosophila navojoa TaxID=7232 RepID=A0A484BSE2_DRONA|nr:uncharacterized protein LOC108652698 [Drosophila navojoa]TDG51719.1 hypothetical protein AWZ03_001779 [Drosophila navojoa]